MGQGAFSGEALREIFDSFQFDSTVTEAVPYGLGHINRTYLITTLSGRRYILQRISEAMTSNIPGLMRNIALITEHLRRKTTDERAVLSLLPAKDGRNFYQSEAGFFRVYHFVEGTITRQMAESAEEFYQSALGFGGFLEMLSDFPPEELFVVIPDFHNTPDRLLKFRETLRKDPLGRAQSVRKEIDFYLSREKEMGILQGMLDQGHLPLRVTHNDTKLNNVLLDEKTHRALCVVDLDTVMPGLSAWDFGDAIRFGASTGAEDERDLEKIRLSLPYFSAFAQGYLEACPGLTEKEREVMPLGALTITLECGMRFLTDYIDGDHYYAIAREGHNLDRARTQIRLAEDMEGKMEEMKRAIVECS